MLQISKDTSKNADEYNIGGEKLLSKRKYCVFVVKGGEALTLTNKIIDRMRKDY